MSQARQTLINTQSQFYRDGFRKIVFMLFVLMMIAYGLLGIIVYQHMTRPTPQYFVTTSSGRLIEITPVAPVAPAVTPIVPAPVAVPAPGEPVP